MLRLKINKKKVVKGVDPVLEKQQEDLMDEINMAKVHHKEKKSSDLKRLKIDPNDWTKFPIRDKSEIILDWSVSGGIVGGKRYSRAELSQVLGMTYKEVEKKLEDIEKSSKSLFSDSSAIREKVSSLLDHTFYHAHKDKSRAILHANILEQQLEIVQEKMKECLETKDEVIKRDLGRWMGFYKTLSYQKIESIRILLECNNAIVNLLALFKQGGRDSKDKGFTPFMQDPDVAPEDSISREKAIELLENKVPPNLPKTQAGNSGPRNPNSGFEDLETTATEDVKKTIAAGIH